MTADALARLHARAFSATRAWSVQEFADLLNHPGTYVEGDNDSFILVRTVADEAEVLTIATDPDLRRQGRARTALAKGEETAQEMGATVMFLEVAEDNAAALALYVASGYQKVGRRPGYYLPKDGAPIAALVLRKALTTS